MALTDPESFGQVVEAPLLEKDVNSYEQAIKTVQDRLDFFAKEHKDDQVYQSYVSNLKEMITSNEDEILRNAAIFNSSDDVINEFKANNESEAIFIDIQQKLSRWFDSVDEGLLKYTIKAVQSFMHNNKDTLAASTDSTLVEAQKTITPFTNGTTEKETPSVITNGTSNQGSEDSKSTGGAPTDPSTLPSTDPSVKAEDVEVVAAKVEVKSGNSSYRKGAKKEFVWYKDNHSKAPTEVPREQGVSASGITEFTPSKAKMEMDNPVPREPGVAESEISEFNVEKTNQVDLAKPISRDEGVKDAPKEFIKVNESANYQSNLRAILRAIKESNEI
jgi:hypothetical protein